MQIEREGEGVNTFPNGDIFKGTYKKGVRNGQGKYFWKEKIAKYVGNYENHKKEGYGVMKYPDGAKYDGLYLNIYILFSSSTSLSSFFITFFFDIYVYISKNTYTHKNK
jgi:hypothetical protein